MLKNNKIKILKMQKREQLELALKNPLDFVTRVKTSITTAAAKSKNFDWKAILRYSVCNIPGPNDFVNEDQEEAKTEDDWKNGETPAGEGKKGWLIWVQMACLILATLGLFAKLYSKCKSCCQCCIDWRCAGGDEEQQLNSDTIICYLCNKKSKKSSLYTVFENHPKCRS